MSLSLALSVPSETLVFTAGLAVTGFSASFIGGVVGSGGGLIAVPIIQYLFVMLGLDNATAMVLTVGTCSAWMIFGSAIATWREKKRGLVEWTAMKRWVVPVFAGVLLAHFTGLGQNGTAMKYIYAGFISAIAIYMMIGSDKWRLHDDVPQGRIWSVYGAIVGFICSLTGNGGTVMTVPLLHACNVRLHKAITTSSVIGLMVGIPSAFFYLQAPTIDMPFTVGSINLMAAVVLAAAGWFGRPLGLHLQRRLSATTLHKSFVAILLITATRLCWITLSA